MSTKTNIEALQTLLESGSFTNADVVVGAIPSSSRGVDNVSKKFSRGNSTIMIMPKGYNPSVISRNTQGLPSRYESQSLFSITIYSRFLLSDKDEDLTALHDGVLQLLVDNRYEWISSDISEAPQDIHNTTYYSAKIQVAYLDKYRKV